jgi:DNA-binding NtrC family response regulator
MAVRILVVDDEKSIRDIVSTYLTLQGYEVAGATDGEDALALLQVEDFDVVLLDIDMPKRNGLHVLRFIRTRHLEVRPIMLSGNEDLLALNECAKWGAHDFLPKPCNFHELLESIERVLSERVVVTELV